MQFFARRFLIPILISCIVALGALGFVSRVYAGCTAGPDMVCDGNNSVIVNTPAAGDSSITNTGDAIVIVNAPDNGDGTVNNSGDVDVIVNAPVGDGITSDGNGTVNNSGNVTVLDNVSTGDGTVNNSGDVSGVLVNSSDGDGTVNNSGNVDGVLVNDSGGDGVVNNSGTVSLLVNSACGDATVNHSGTADDIVNETCSGTATIILSGTVNGDVTNSGDTDNNQVVLQDGAVVNGVIDGDAGPCGCGGNDALVFNMTVDEDNYDAIAQQIAAANPQGGTIVINGHSYEWANFTELRNLLKKLFFCVKDARINGCDPKQTMAGYCKSDGGLSIYEVNLSKGKPTLDISKAQIASALAEAKRTNKNVLISSDDGRDVWALSSGQLQMHDSRAAALHGAPYDYIFEGNRCG